MATIIPLKIAKRKTSSPHLLCSLTPNPILIQIKRKMPKLETSKDSKPKIFRVLEAGDDSPDAMMICAWWEKWEKFQNLARKFEKRVG